MSSSPSPADRYEALSGFIENAADIEAPVSRGQQVGDIVIELDGDTLLRVPLVALATVDEGGIVRRAIDSVLRLF
jgi:D-alanyl-D-alanine carboxypeptidase (penicillin-binding protein 5/6)